MTSEELADRRVKTSAHVLALVLMHAVDGDPTLHQQLANRHPGVLDDLARFRQHRADHPDHLDVTA